MRGVNKVILVGNVGRDPEVRYLPSGGAVTNITLATSEAWRDKATWQMQEQTEWHRVVFYGKLAEVVGEFTKKGSKLYIEGSLHTRKWQDKQTGQDKYSTEIKANAMQMLDGRNGGGQQGGDEPHQGQYYGGQDYNESQRQQDRREARPAGQRDQPPRNADQFDDDIPF